MANIKEIRGNIFDSHCQTIVNTVNCKGVMGKGLALEFALRYEQMAQAFEQACKEGRIRPGKLFLWKKTTPWILNFPTKDDWKKPSKLEYIEEGLKEFCAIYKAENIRSIAFPQLGTHLGGLDWQSVKKLMYSYLQPLPDIDIEIYIFDPNASDRTYQRLSKLVYEHKTSLLELPESASELIERAVLSGQVKNMFQLQQIKGLGKKTFTKIYKHLAGQERQLFLFE